MQSMQYKSIQIGERPNRSFASVLWGLVSFAFCIRIARAERSRDADVNLVTSCKYFAKSALPCCTANSNWRISQFCSICRKSPDHLLSQRLIWLPFRSPSDQLHILAFPLRSWQLVQHRPKRLAYQRMTPLPQKDFQSAQ